MAVPRTPLRESIFHHVALPPRLPSRQETGIEGIRQDLTRRLHDASILLKNTHTKYEVFARQWEHIRQAIAVSQTLHADGKLDRDTLLQAFEELKENDMLILHVSEQNAALLIRRSQR